MTAARVAFDAQLAELRRNAARLTAELQAQPRLQVAADTIRQLDELRARTAAISREALGLPSAAGGSAAPPELERGARVRSVTLEQDGTVVEPPDGRGRVRVAFGAVSMQVDASDLRSAGSQPVSKAPRRVSALPLDLEPEPAATPRGSADVPFTPQSERNTCDMRGMRVEEALGELTRFLERAARDGERRGILIHGRGTGALRAAVREVLPHEPRVEGFRPGGDGEGGDGVTVVSLR